MKKIENCPICGAQGQALFLSTADHSFTREPFSIVQCSDCGFRFTNPIPEQDKIGEYYKSDDYISHTSSRKGLFESLYHIVRKYTIKKKFHLVDRFSRGGSHLDIGCGTGEFLAYVKNKGWNTKGLEPSERARQYAKDNYGLDVDPVGTLEDLPDNYFDSITMWHVLEHVYCLNTDFEHYKRVLKDDGTLIVAVPNCASYDARHYKEFWAAYDLPIHLYHFRTDDVHALASKHGMEVVKVLPMKFDRFYVSMLSEKYKSGKEKLSPGMMLRGMYRGMLSNVKAAEGTWSSQIYVLTAKR